MGYPIDLDDFQHETGKWGDAMFPTTNQESVIAHLRAEVNEELTPDCDPHELADAAILILQLAHIRGVSLMGLMISKMQINRDRQWGKPNDRGFTEHVKPTPKPERDDDANTD